MNDSHPTYSDLLAANARQRETNPEIERYIPSFPMLITGITGVAGYNCLAYFQQRFPGKVFGIVPPDTVGFSAPDCFVGNMEDMKELDAIFNKYRFRSILDCAGNCALKACQLDPRIAWALNVEVIYNLARLAQRYDARLVHLSVDMVFAGRPGGGYRETEEPTPVNVYGQTMVEGEKAVMAENAAALTLRISMPMGISFNGHAGAIDWIGARFKANRPATLYYDEVRTPTYTDCMNRAFRVFLSNDHAGILHSGGPRQVSLYQMAQIINRVGGFPPELLYGLMKDEACPVPPRVSNCGLDSTAMEQVLGFPPFDPWPYDERFMPTDRLWHYRRRPDERGSVALLNSVLCLNPRLGPRRD